jgi:hypothetical protein
MTKGDQAGFMLQERGEIPRLENWPWGEGRRGDMERGDWETKKRIWFADSSANWVGKGSGSVFGGCYTGSTCLGSVVCSLREEDEQRNLV